MSLLFALVIGVLLIAFGVSVSSYLYRHGAIGYRSLRRVRRLNTVAAKPVYEESNDVYSLSPGSAESETTRYARHSLFAFLVGLLVVAMLAAMMLSTVLH